MKYLTKENITFVIAILAFLLSVAQWIYTLWCSRTHFNAEITNIEKAPNSKGTRYTFTFLINNLSSAPLVITKATIQHIDCNYLKKWIGERYFPKFPETDVPTTEQCFSSEIPLNLVPHSSSLCTLVFNVEKGEKLNLASPIAVTFRTTKKIKTFKLESPDDSHPYINL